MNKPLFVIEASTCVKYLKYANELGIETIVTDSNGEAITNRYPVRDYETLRIQECETLWNYKLNDEIKTIELTAEQITNITVENELKKGQVRVIKVDKDNNEIRLQGVEFKIYDEDNNLVDTIITDENGEAISKRLRIDKEYTVIESKTLSEYVLNEEPEIFHSLPLFYPYSVPPLSVSFSIPWKLL